MPKTNFRPVPDPSAPKCMECGAAPPACNGGCLPVALAAILAEVSRTRIYALIEREQLKCTVFNSQKFVCVPDLMRWIDTHSEDAHKEQQ